VKSFLTNAFGADLRSLAALRIGCAFIILLDLASRSTDLVAHYTDFGVVPRTLVMQQSSSRWYISLHYLSGVWQLEALLFGLAAVAAGALLVGYRTRLAGALSWLLFVSLCGRNPYVLQGGDQLLRVVLFWGMFLPWGAVYSVDAAWGRNSPPPGAEPYLSWGTAAYALQILFMYWFTAVLKSAPQWWSEGSAVYYALNIDYLVTPLGNLLRDAPEVLLKFATWSVLAFEIVGPLALLLPLRRGQLRLATVCCFMLLHASFLLTLFIGIFPLVGMVSTLFFVPALFWDFFARRAAGAPAIKIYYDDDCGFCRRGVRLIRTFLLPSAQLAGAQTAPEMEAEMRRRNSWIVIDDRGARRYGYDGVIAVASAAPIIKILLPWMRLGPVRRCGEQLYRCVAAHRQTSCELPSGGSAPAAALCQWPKAVDRCAILLLAYVFVYNLANIPGLGVQIPESLRSVSDLTGLNQLWNMFAPFPAKDDGWYVIPGRLKDGRVVDLFRGGGPVEFGKPAHAALEFKNHRWRKYMELLRKREPLQPLYASYLCREWNRSHSGGEALGELEIIYVLEWTRPSAEYSPIERQSVFKAHCAN